MKYHRLYIDTNNDIETYNQITKLLGIQPTKFERKNKFDDTLDFWTHTVDTEDDEPYFDFINRFLDILEPKFNELKGFGIDKSNITFWLLYEYDQQCGLEFHPQEMKRLGESGIVMCIDCWQSSKPLID
jgi:hypothetical protein